MVVFALSGEVFCYVKRRAVCLRTTDRLLPPDWVVGIAEYWGNWKK